MEEALWNLEDKWKLSTQKAIAIFACTSFLVLGICIAAFLRKFRRRGTVHQEPCNEAPPQAVAPPVCLGRLSVAKVLMGSVRWSGRSEWEERLRGSQRSEAPTPLLVKRDNNVVGGQSHNSSSAVWQRPILMGGKCELPRFSGLILYDQRGMPLHQFQQQDQALINKEDETSAAVLKTTLRDLL